MYYMIYLKDLSEIAFYSFIIYSLCIWLKTDSTKNLIPYFFGYCCLLIGSWIAYLPTLTTFLWNYAPVTLIIGIIIHEKTLQRNLVTLCSLTPTQQPQEDWLDTIFNATFLLMNNNKSITIIIENRDALEHFLTTPFLINAHLSKDLLHILLTTHFYDHHKMMWVTMHGILRAINSTWFTATEDTPSQAIFNKNDALFYTLQCDALVLHAHPIKRLFTLIHQGKEYDAIAPHDIQALLKKLLHTTTLPSTKRYTHETTTPENHTVS